MQNPFEGREIWFLTGSQGLYGEEVLSQVAEQSQGIVAQLNESGKIPVPIVWKPVLKDRGSIREVAKEADFDSRCIGIIAWMHTFSPAKMWISGLVHLDKPLLHLHTQSNVELPWRTIDMEFMNLNQSAHGDREFGYIATRLGVNRKTVFGHVSTSKVQERIGRWARAATGWAELQVMQLARFGDNMRNVADTEGDKTEAEARLGVAVNTWGVNDLVEVVDKVDDAAIDKLVSQYEHLYDVAPELRASGERRESLRYGARQELGMREFLNRGKFTAFTTNFEDLGGLRQLPGLAVQRLESDGYGFGAEGDWKTAILVRVAKVMGYGLAGGASLMEDYTYELTPGREKTLGAHMLEVCPSLTNDKPSLEIHPLAIGNREDPVRLRFTASPGPGIVVSLSDMRDRFRLIANTVELVEPDEPLEKLPCACAVWLPQPDLETSVECWLMAGGVHHTVMTTNVPLEVFEDLAEIAGIELATIDAGSTVSKFRNDLRLNQAYFHLRQGIA